MPDQEPPKRTVQMYDRPASADRPPLGRIIPLVVVLLLAALTAAWFIFHAHSGQPLSAGH